MAHTETIDACSRVNLELYNFLNNNAGAKESYMLAEILENKKVRQKLESPLGYFAEYKKGSQADRKEMKDNEIYGFIPLTSLAEDLNLEANLMFEVLDAFFYTHKSILTKVENYVEEIKKYKDKNATRAGDLQNHLEGFMQQLKPEITSFYYDERSYLIKSLIIIVLYDYSAGEDSASVIADVYKHLQDKNILVNLTNSLENNLKQHPDKKKDNAEKLEFLHQKLKEEELILQCIFCLLLEPSDQNNKWEAVILKLIKYFIDNNFNGYFAKRDLTTMITEKYQHLFQKEAAIRDLSIFVAFVCLSINVPELDINQNI